MDVTLKPELARLVEANVKSGRSTTPTTSSIGRSIITF